jgi:hypothetical protein
MGIQKSCSKALLENTFVAPRQWNTEDEPKVFKRFTIAKEPQTMLDFDIVYGCSNISELTIVVTVWIFCAS